MELTDLQKTCWVTVGNESVATEKIRNGALQYYLEYREHLNKTNKFMMMENQIQNLFLISYFIAQKSDILYDLNGKKTSVAFSINQLAKKNTDHQDLFYHLKEMMKHINIPQQAKQAEAQITAITKYFSFIMTFYNKFLSTFDKISISHKNNDLNLQNQDGKKQYKDKIKYFLWLLHISFRKAVFNNNIDTIENTCLLACIFTFFVTEIYKQKDAPSVSAQQITKSQAKFPQNLDEAEQVILGFFCLKDMKTYQKVRNYFLQFVQKLGQKVIQLEYVFSYTNLANNIKDLQKFYHNNMQNNQMDETLFLRNLVSNQFQMNFTAFGAKRKVGKHHSNNMQCRRIINYEEQIKNHEKNLPTNRPENSQNMIDRDNYELKVMHKIKASKTPVMLIQKATPVSQFSMAYNWLFKKQAASNQIKQGLNSEQIDNLEQLLSIGYQYDQYQLGNNKIIEKRGLIDGLFVQLLNQYKDPTQEDVHLCRIMALEVFYHVMNITNRSFTQLINHLKISWFSVWICVNKLLNYDKTMPHTIKTHVLILQTQIVSSLIWKDDSFVQQLGQRDIPQVSRQFFNRVLHHIAYQINFIGKTIHIEDTLMDHSFILCQYYLKQWGSLMKNVSLDVIIMCSLYGVCKAKSVDIRFKNIMAAFKTVNNMDLKSFQAIDMFQSSQGESFNIILYYNKVFLRFSKSILFKIKEEKLQDDQQINCVNYLLSPVKSILPDQGIIRGNGTSNHSQMLQAYNESPLLRRNKKVNVGQNIKNKENNDGINTPRTSNFNDSKILNHSQKLKDISNKNHDMIVKKFGKQKTYPSIVKGYHPRQN